MTKVLHRNMGAPPPEAVRSEGCRIFDRAGKAYIDASGGAAVSCLGHGHPRVIDALRDAIGRLQYVHTGSFTHSAQEELAEVLVEGAPANISHAFFVSSGSEAVESALKLARQYFLEIGEPKRRHFIARRQSYHGNTLGALAVGGNALRRSSYQPLLMKASHISPCYAYRDKFDGESLEAYGLRVANELQREILSLGPESVAGFIAEPVVGATLGAAEPAPGYFRRIREICDQYGVLLIADEIMCGGGRTGDMYSMEAEGAAADIITIAKGLGGGYQPIGAMLLSNKIAEAIRTGSGSFMHGHTYLGHPLACSAALAVQKVIREENLLTAVRVQGARLMNGLKQALGQHPNVGDIRGRGLLIGLEFVKNRETKTPFDPSLKLNQIIKKEAMERGVMVYPMPGTIDGINGDHIVLAPPFIASDSEIDEIVSAVAGAIPGALEGVLGC
ncbi:MAG: aspartate aminotransferase family protein [Rhodospirillales bacterium]|jgi:adenosylmethionine-8-amino-7-oxononanoate aminotransferase